MSKQDEPKGFDVDKAIEDAKKRLQEGINEDFKEAQWNSNRNVYHAVEAARHGTGTNISVREAGPLGKHTQKVLDKEEAVRNNPPLYPPY